ncbi:MAG TPA: response regulator, partial [Candidatus Sumerlaeota bacterium]|nr:response regulator [Candidatus Sumerlaeota bacterium]
MSPGILIVDKDQRSNEHLRGLLHPRFEVHAAPTVEEGADLLSRISFDLLISDFGMLCSPDTGAALRLRAIQPALPLCLISSNDTERYLSTL